MAMTPTTEHGRTWRIGGRPWFGIEVEKHMSGLTDLVSDRFFSFATRRGASKAPRRWSATVRSACTRRWVFSSHRFPGPLLLSEFASQACENQISNTKQGIISCA
eukprot:2071972-Rhodomonas_salina.1